MKRLLIILSLGSILGCKSIDISEYKITINNDMVFLIADLFGKELDYTCREEVCLNSTDTAIAYIGDDGFVYGRSMGFADIVIENEYYSDTIHVMVGVLIRP